MKPIEFFPKNQSILLRSSDWNLWLNKVKIKDKRTMFALSVSEVIYNPKTTKFSYKKLKEDPIWLSKANILELIKILEEMITGAT